MKEPRDSFSFSPTRRWHVERWYRLVCHGIRYQWIHCRRCGRGRKRVSRARAYAPMRRACALPVVGDGVSARRGPKTCPRQWVALPSPVKAAGSGPLVAVPRERTLRNVPCGAVPDVPPNGLMYVITRRQPWASPIALGVKTVETRSWPAAGSSDRSNHRQTRRQTAGQATGRSHRTAAAGSPGRELAQVYPGWSGAATAILAGMGLGN